MTLSAIIFDMDGLLLDTEIIGREAWQRAAAEFGATLSNDDFGSIIGLTRDDTASQLHRLLGETFPVAEARERRLAIGKEILLSRGIRQKPGASEALSLASKSYKTALATSTERLLAAERLRIAGMSHCFDALVTGEEVARGKPHPDIFLRAAELLQTKAEHCFVLEDSNPGVRAGVAAGATVIMVPDLSKPDAFSRKHAFRILDSLLELPQLLEEVSKRTSST